MYHTLYVIFADNVYDQTVETCKSAVLEMLDLQAMGCSVKCFAVESDNKNACWEAVNTMEALSDEGKPVGRKRMKYLEESLLVQIHLHGIRSLVKENY